MTTATSEYLEVQTGDRDELVLANAELVKRIAYHLVSKLPPSVDVQDLIQAGMIGLLEAATSYSPDGGANFRTYAGIRIRGAMLDEIRRLDWTPRSVHRKVRELSAAMSLIENRTGRDARDRDIADELGISMEEYHKVLRDSASARLCSFDQISSEDGSHEPPRNPDPDPLQILEQSNFIKSLAAEIDRLPEREKLVMSLYYDDELNLREIGEILEVSESRVCQIHGQALGRLRSRLNEWTARE
ncbi:MAG: RNA polymerase sigma factor FliA [Gammaproteobacteria bacterium]|nr:RNA polymerase sigma factor FliA [Gammaproteobacteria bacterium]NNF60040.1 RNA polymerase sigma factor FliA [Gammaproteobacteria bacterium]NNM19971.1 RNA polymerase sigma factor FliA [Gammaproteobacteria bacterium]